MKVTLINTSDAGGGAPAAGMRLLKALRQKKVDAKLLVKEKKTEEPAVIQAGSGRFYRFINQINFLYERLPFIWFRAKSREVRFAFSPADAGIDISDNPAVKNADILHLHFTNLGFLSINDIKKLLTAGKPVVWTLHDMWTFTGGCHYSADCDHFLQQCGNCWMLRSPGDNDSSHSGWLHKAGIYNAAGKKPVMITCSRWLAGVAKTSSLLKDFRIEAIPNPIDVSLFSPGNKEELRKRWNINQKAKIVLFGAANILDRRKGLNYLVEALDILKTKYDGLEDMEIVIFGKNKSFDVNVFPFKVNELSIIRSQQQMAELYGLADLFVTPAIEDNLPNTVMESLACGTPVVAFDTGGLPEMVDHMQNGYLAEFKSAADLATGIHWILTSDKKSFFAENARKKVLDNFTNDIVAEKYLAVYQSIL